MTKVKIDSELYEKLKQCSQTAGYSSVDEFIQHALEKEVESILSDDDDEEKIKERLRGLGYIS